MSRHRYPCTAEPPADLVAPGVLALHRCRNCAHLVGNHWEDDERSKPGCHAKGCLCSMTPSGIDPSSHHRHRCIRDREDWLDDEALLEHECECGMTWQATSLAPAPDNAWIQMESSPAGPGIWPLIAVAAIVALIVGAVVEVLR